jgi:hypothetical protein
MHYIVMHVPCQTSVVRKALLLHGKIFCSECECVSSTVSHGQMTLRMRAYTRRICLSRAAGPLASGWCKINGRGPLLVHGPDSATTPGERFKGVLYGAGQTSSQPALKPSPTAIYASIPSMTRAA